MVRADGIEPTTLAWEAKVLPLNYARSTTVTLQFLNTRSSHFL